MEKRVLFKSMAVAALALPMVLVSCKEDKKSSSSKSIAVDSVALNIHDTTIFVGDNVQFSYTIFPNDATNKDVEWSGDEEILIISNSGQVAGKAAGTGYVFITTVSGEHKDSCKINVIQNIEIKDENFLKALLSNTSINTDNDPSGISRAEASAVTSLDISDKKIASLEGIEYFTYLKELICNSNQLTSLDLSNMPNLQTLRCQNNQISSLDLSGNPELTTLVCNKNNLDTLDIRNNTKLSAIVCGNQSTGNLKLQLSIDQFNSVWKETGSNSNNSNVDMVMNIFEGATFHSDDLESDLKNGDSTTFDLYMGGFSFRLFDNTNKELSFYDKSVLRQITWSSSNESVATITTEYEDGESANTAKMTIKTIAKGNTTITGTVNDEYTISFNLEVK